MYQKSFDSLITLLHNKYANKELAKAFFFNCNFLHFIMNHIFNKKFKFDSGKEINDGLFAFLLETAYNVAKSENLYLLEVLSEGIFLTNSDITWRNFINKFVNPIKERLAKGMVFPQGSNHLIKKILSKNQQWSQHLLTTVL